MWQQLTGVAIALHAIRGGQSGTAALAAVDAVLRPGVQALLFQVLRQAGRAEVLRSQLASRKPPPAADALLCTALALCWNPQEAPYDPFTLVNQAVEAAKNHAATRGQASFINGCLRRFLRERDALVAATDHDPLAHWNHPRWWVDLLCKDHPSHWEQILRANNAHAPMTLRVNQQKTTVAEYLSALNAIDLGATQLDGTGIALQQPAPVERLPGFDQGWVSVQDAAAQRAAPLLLQGMDLSKPLRVLDA
ncbi:MAG: 16S rRNA (cytosine(967)-C(5))-methyltransferase RsmB, partial [Burkholderiaceae bacterium]|nr:16S rRNA (cytosine(967)-C(5))-methyltransferase RsmB [Burkholderiaceae bacterium]